MKEMINVALDINNHTNQQILCLCKVQITRRQKCSSKLKNFQKCENDGNEDLNHGNEEMR